MKKIYIIIETLEAYGERVTQPVSFYFKTREEALEWIKGASIGSSLLGEKYDVFEVIEYPEDKEK
jgi:hypothetical protein